MRALPRASRDARGATHSDHIGVFRQRQAGLNYFGLKTPVGRVTADQLDELARLGERYGQGELRFTPSQDVLLPHVPDARLGDLTQEPLVKELPYNPSEVRRGLVSCTGTDFCNLALIDTKTRAMALAREFEKHVGKTRPITVRRSGCPASCAHHHTADIGLQGCKVRVDGKVALLPREIAPLTEVVADVRRALSEDGVSLDAERWRRALGGELRSLMAAGRTTEARARLRERLGV